jgi:hypothetical protein
MDKKNDHSELMHRREITLKDGRYMIFYTFDEALSAAARQKAPDKGGTRPEPEAAEKKDV